MAVNYADAVASAMYKQIQSRGFAAPVDVLMDIGVLSRPDYDRWRRGQVPYLEKVCRTNLKKLSTIMHAIRAYAQKEQLKPSFTYYKKIGGHASGPLRFSKSGDRHIEHNYATHYVSTKKLPPKKQPTVVEDPNELEEENP